MDYGKMKVVELRAELQARGLDTKGIKAALIDRLKEALDLEQQHDTSTGVPITPAVSQEPIAETPSTETQQLRRSSRSRTKSPEPIVTKIQDPTLTPLEEEPEEQNQKSEQSSTVDQHSDSHMYEKIIDEMEVDESNNQDDMNEDELLAEPEDTTNTNINTQEKADDETLPAEKEIQASEEKATTDDENRGTKRRSDSPSKGNTPKKRQRLPPPNIEDFVNDEDEPELDETALQLSWFDSDLNLKINPQSLSDTGLALVWAGARANYGALNNGKYFYEVQLVAFNTKINYPNERNLHEIRCGWATTDTNLQLGESPTSFGLDSSGKKCCNSEFTNYASRLHVDDVIGVHLELNEEKCSIQFTINGKDQGIAFDFERTLLNDRALFPHVSTKNIEYKVNFGQIEPSLWSLSRDKYKENELKRKRAELERKKKDFEKKREEKLKKEAEMAKKVEENQDAEASSEAQPTEETASDQPQPVAVPEPVEEEKKEEVVEEPQLPDEITEDEINQDTPIENILPGFYFINKYPVNQLSKGPRRSEARTDCEVIMMIGLPGAGKSHWALERAAQFPEKRYTLLGTKHLLERMKIQGVPRKPGSGPGRWEKLIELCNRGLLTLNEIACQRRRNYILDQPHVYISDQRRKMRVYGDFKRIAVIVVPSEEDYKKRFKQRLDTEGKDIPESAVNEMRANLTLPELEYQWFNEIIYADMEKEAAQTEVSKENERGKKALSQRNRHNDFNRGGGRDFNNRNDRRWGGRNDRNDFRRNDRWGPPNQGHRGNNMGGGYRRDFDFNSRGGRNWNGPDNWMNRPRQGGYGGAPPPRPGRKPSDNRGGNRDRRDFRPQQQQQQQQQGTGNNINRNRDRRSDGNKKFGNKNDWNSQGGSGGAWGNNNWGSGGNNYGGSQGGGWGNNQWNQTQYGGSNSDGSSDANQQWLAYYQQTQQAGQQGWYSDQNYGGAFSSNSSYDNNQTKQ
ncbi:CLUMA_CG011748, isoform A [Clunio marinus]|uniref:CLUMA_CG011748, isoform A n=1 Tax=Clunio marinus TaxID=568069 RepID=A0A1J1IDQ1_9DIPT|nr:CLUMA_CG011748, isoform A [Clunio marinus]